MAVKVKTVDANKTIGDCLRAMGSADVGCLVVVEGRRPVGIFTERDVVRKLSGSRRIAKLPVKRMMSTPLITVAPMDTVWDAIALMSKNDIRRLPVVEGDQLVGIITERDILLQSFNYYHGMIG